ncbi:MAG: 30S ribosome-binding factor RbfA [Chloroflexota bacterium]
MSKIRQQRVAEGLRAELMDLLQNELRDPRLNLVTITDVTIDRELRHASVFVSALAGPEEQRQIMQALEGATGFLRREIARRIHLRVVPELRFRWDPSLERGERIGQILDRLEIPPEATSRHGADSDQG